MKFSVLLSSLALATTTFSTPTLQRRDLSTITDVLSTVKSDVEALDTKVNAYNGKDASELKSASATLISDITDGTKKIEGLDDLTTSDALGLPGPVQALTGSVKTVIDDLISKKSALVDAGEGPFTYKSLQDQYAAADALGKAITSKVPEALRGIASQLAAGITDAIQKGVDAFKDAATASRTDASAPPTDTATAPPTDTASGTETAPPTATATATATGSGSATPTATGTKTKPTGGSTPSGSFATSPTGSFASGSFTSGPTKSGSGPAPTKSSGGGAGGSGGSGSSPTPSPTGPPLSNSANKLGGSIGALAIAAMAMVM